jgi:hypothetical protein
MNRGDHLVSPRLGYEHHGLYVGFDQVIHYSGFSEAFDKGSIEITTLEEFTQGNSCRIMNHLVCIYDAEERVERAFSKLGEDSYNMIFNNCEHFVNWCFNGLKTSSQVNRAVAVTANTINTANLANIYTQRKSAETVVSMLYQPVTRTALTKAAASSVTSAIARSAASTTVSTAAGITAASAVTGTTAVSVASALAAGSVASVAAPVAIAVGVGVGVGYGVKKAIDWLFD